MILSFVADTSGDDAAATAALAKAPKAPSADSVKDFAVTCAFLDASGAGEGVPTSDGIVSDLVSN